MNEPWAKSIAKMLDEMEETRTINAPVMVAALRKAVRELDWYAGAHSPETLLTIGGDLAAQALCSIEQILLGGGGLGESLTPALERKAPAVSDTPTSGPLNVEPPAANGALKGQRRVIE